MAAKGSSGHKKRARRRPAATHLAAVLIILTALPLLASGLHFAKIEFDAFGAEQAALLISNGRVLEPHEQARMRAQLMKAASIRPTRSRLEWASEAMALDRDALSEIEREEALLYLRHRLARNPASHPTWAQLTVLERKWGRRPASARVFRGAYETGAYMPSSAIWAIAMGQRNWVFLDADVQADVEKLTYDLFSFAPAATATIAGPKWRELYMRDAMDHDPKAIRLFERYLTLYFDPAYNRQ